MRLHVFFLKALRTLKWINASVWPSNSAAIFLTEGGKHTNLARDLWQTLVAVVQETPLRQPRHSPRWSPFRGSEPADGGEKSLAIPTPDSSWSSGKNCRMLRLRDSVPDRLRTHDAPSAGYRCRRLAPLFGVCARAGGLHALSRGEGLGWPRIRGIRTGSPNTSGHVEQGCRPAAAPA